MPTIETEPLEHQHGNVVFDAVLAIDREATASQQPTVLVCHGIEGRSQAQEEFTRKLARQGYVGVAVDLFGREATRGGQEQRTALMGTFLHDRSALHERLLHVLEVVRSQPAVDRDRVAAIGFCFGGLCVLDLARIGGEVRGVASFHGILTPPDTVTTAPVSAKVAAFHGWDDPYAPPADVVAFGTEMTERGADWQLHAYGHAMHAFMSETANDPGSGVRYDPVAARRAWSVSEYFLAEALA